MDPAVNEWLNLILRWMHIVAAIMWIGHSFFFMWLDANLVKTSDDADEQGELWMVHSGGFYRVLKKTVIPKQLPGALHWFKWEATATAVTGLFLLVVVYYLGGTLVDPDSSTGFGTAAFVGLGLLPVAWLVYDVLWRSPLAQAGKLGAVVSFGLLMGVSYGLSQVLSGRAAYIHVGVMLGTLMVINVWARILPAQTQLIAAIESGKRPDDALAKQAKTRSIHNNYMTFPVIFIMISNHFPGITYGYSWVMLGAIMLAGAGIRHVMNVGRAGVAAASVSLIALVAAGIAVRPGGGDEPEVEETETPETERAGKTIDPATVGSITGSVRFTGTPPAANEIQMQADAECARQHSTPAQTDAALVADGRVQNAFVYIKEGLEDYRFETPKDEVVLDQKACIYVPHVVGVQVKQPLVFVNSDATNHNVHALAEDNRQFNFSMPAKGMRDTKKFRKPEVMVKTKCDVHPWMAAYVGVLAHPFFRVTGEDGNFSLEGLPPGEYVVEVWHEVFGTRTASVSLAAGGAEKIELVFE